MIPRILAALACLLCIAAILSPLLLMGCAAPGDGQNAFVDPKAFAAAPWP